MKSKKLQVSVVAVLMLTAFLIPSMNSRWLGVHAIKFSSTTSSPPPIEWNQTYGGTGKDEAHCVIQTIDGGYALAGYTNSSGPGYYDFYLVKTDANGNMQWSKTYGESGDDKAYSMVQTSDGGYALAGYTNSSGAGGYDFRLVKTYPNGTMQWNQTYGGLGNDYARSVVQTIDGGYALAGYTNSSGGGGYDFWLVKTYPNGTMQWNQPYGGAGDDVAYSVVQTSDGGYALAGYTTPFGSILGKFWLVKTCSNGTIEWNRPYSRGVEDEAHSVIQTADGGYALAGYTFPYLGGGCDFWLVNTDSNGNMQWNQTYDLRLLDEAYSVIQTSDGGYALAGYTNSLDAGGYDFWLVKANSSGNMQWNQTYGGANDDTAYSVIQTSDGGYALAGYTSSYGVGGYDFYLVKARLCTLAIQPSTGGTTDPPPGTYNCSVGEVVTVNATPDANYLFDHWMLNGVYNSTNPISVTMNTDYSLQAFFTPSYTLTVNTFTPPDNATSGGTTNPTPGTHIYSSGQVLNVTAFPNTGYLFDHWRLDSVNKSTNPISVTMNTDYSLQAFFTPSYTLTVNTFTPPDNATSGGTTNPTPGTHIYSSGQVLNVTAFPNTGYYLYYWELDGNNNGTRNPISLIMNTNHTLKAVFIPITYTLTITITAGGTTSPSGTCIYPSGYVANVTASPSTGYYLCYWELDSKNVGASNPINITMNTNHHLEAVFALLHHDITVTNVTSSKTVVCQGFNCSDINVTVANQGSYTETFNVTVYVNDTDTGNTTCIATFMNVTLAIYTSANLTFDWNTAGFARGNYTISAYAEPVPDETDMDNNNFTDGLIGVSMVGDLTGGTPNAWDFVPDGVVDGSDLSIVAKCYGSWPAAPPPMTWNANCDVNNDGVVDGSDLAIIARHFGEGSP